MENKQEWDGGKFVIEIETLCPYDFPNFYTLPDWELLSEWSFPTRKWQKIAIKVVLEEALNTKINSHN